MKHYSLEAETATLSCCLYDDISMNIAFENLKVEDFYFTKHQTIFKCMSELVRQNTPVNSITLGEELTKTNKLSEVGGYTYLTTLETTVPINRNIEAFNDIILDYSKRRKIWEYLELAKEGKIEIEEAVTKITTLPDYKVDETTLEILLTNTIENATKGVAHKFKLKEFNKYLGGVDKGELITIGGYTSSGKTSLAVALAIDFSSNEKNVLYLSAEMTEQETARRILANLLPINVKDLRKGNIQRQKRALEDLSRIIAQEWKFNVKRIYNVSDISKYIRKYKPEIVFIDYLQNLTRDGARSDYERVTGNIRDIFEITRKNDITTFCLSQFNREKKEIREPRLSDLRDSGRIEEISNIVILTYWEDRIREKVTDREEGDPPETIKIKISKNRDGAIGNFNLKFKPEYCQFFDEEKYDQRPDIRSRKGETSRLITR